MDWSKKSKGVYYYGKDVLAAENLKMFDFLICKYVEETVHQNIQAAYDAGIPFILFYENNPDDLFDCGLDTSKWPDDRNQSLKDILKAVQINGINLAVSAVMIGGQRTKSANGTTVDEDWLAKSTQHLFDRTWDLTKIPNYLYMDKNPFFVYGNSEAIIKLINDRSPISFPSYPMCENGYPTVSKPALPYDNGKGWAFWLFKPVAGNSISTLYNGTKEQLYSALNFTPKVETGEEVTEDTTEETDVTIIESKFSKALTSGITAFCRAYLAEIEE